MGKFNKETHCNEGKCAYNCIYLCKSSVNKINFNKHIKGVYNDVEFSDIDFSDLTHEKFSIHSLNYIKLSNWVNNELLNKVFYKTGAANYIIRQDFLEQNDVDRINRFQNRVSKEIGEFRIKVTNNFDGRREFSISINHLKTLDSWDVYKKARKSLFNCTKDLLIDLIILHNQK